VVLFCKLGWEGFADVLFTGRVLLPLLVPSPGVEIPVWAVAFYAITFLAPLLMAEDHFLFVDSSSWGSSGRFQCHSTSSVSDGIYLLLTEESVLQKSMEAKAI